MKGIKVFILLIVAGLAVYPAVSFAQENETLSQLIDQALEENPQIQKVYHEWKAQEDKVNVVKGLPDPNINYAYFGESVETRVGPQEQKFGISQKVPFPGKLSLRGKAQKASAKAQEYRYLAMRNEIVKQLKWAYYDLFFVDRSLDTTREQKTILQDSEAVAQRQYESNRLSQQNVVKIQVELSAIMQKIVMLEQNRQSLVAAINRLVHRRADAPVDSLKDLPVPEIVYSLQDLLSLSNESRQELLAANADVKRAKFERSLAKKDYWPDLTFGYEYIDIGGGTTTSANDGQDAWRASVSVNIPLWFGKKQNQVYASRQKLRAAESQERDMEDRVSFEVKDLYYQIIAQKDVINLYETSLLPQAQQVFDSSRVGFESSQTSFLDWLDTERTYLQMRLAYFKSLTDYNKLIASLERVIGQEIGGQENE